MTKKIVAGIAAAGMLFAVGCQDRPERETDSLAYDFERSAEDAAGTVDRETEELGQEADAWTTREEDQLAQTEPMPQEEPAAAEGEVITPEQEQDAWAQAEPQPEPRDPMAEAEAQPGMAQEVNGTLAQASSDSLTVDDRAGEQIELAINEETRLTRNGETIEATELDQGAEVRASYEEKEGEKVATEVEVTEAQPAAEPQEQPIQ